MVLNHISRLTENRSPLRLSQVSVPVPKKKEILVRVSACGVCHTELDEIEGRTPPPKFPIILGHQAIGRVEKIGREAIRFQVGDRVGIAWIFSSCGKCAFCLNGHENLCNYFKATGRDANGGYAQYMTVSEGFAYPIPETFTDVEAAPLLCAGAIGYRSLALTGIKDGQHLGFTGFGASAHLVLKMARYTHPHSKIFVFARSQKERDFAKALHAFWTGDTGDESPERLDAVIDTTPAWKPVIGALKNLKRGGRLIINAIRKEENDKEALMRLSYTDHLWLEKEIKSVANITRKDVAAFLEIAASIPIKPEVEVFPLEDANKALTQLRERKIRGAKVLRID